MSDTKLYLSVGIPSFLVTLAWVTTMVQTNRLSEPMDRLSDKVDRMAEQQHKDILMLMQQIVSLNGRLSKVEG